MVDSLQAHVVSGQYLSSYVLLQRKLPPKCFSPYGRSGKFGRCKCVLVSTVTPLRAKSLGGTAGSCERASQAHCKASRSDRCADASIVEVEGDQVRRYVSNGDSTSGFRVLDEEPPTLNSSRSQPSQIAVEKVTAGLKEYLLPAGYPDTVSSDYLAYMLWTFPCHVTGWLYTSLSTASLLESVGAVKSTPGNATTLVAATAAVKWLTKDGIGALGRAVIGGRYSNLADEDPKRWRMVSEALSVAGSALELGTAVLPGQFLLLASLGNLSKALGKGLSGPSFRVIQQHFAQGNNVGAVAAKEELWEVTAQLLGLLLSVALLENVEVTGSFQSFAATWSVLVAAHVFLRYMAITQVLLPVLNLRRAKMVALHYAQHKSVPSVESVNREEQIFRSAESNAPDMHLGCSLQETLLHGGGWMVRSVEDDMTVHAGAESKAGEGEAVGCSPGECCDHLGLFHDVKYVLSWDGREGRAYVTLKKGAGSQDMLRAIWQAAWLCTRTPEGDDAKRDRTDTSTLQQGSENECSMSSSTKRDMELLTSSCAAANAEFTEFLRLVREAGWQYDASAGLVPSSAPIITIS